eukprot:m.341121 g.341121  ORF g.341121 m.341121 type:complete len:336 (-) comp19830_c0_seq12:9-1016(-)
MHVPNKEDLLDDKARMASVKAAVSSWSTMNNNIAVFESVPSSYLKVADAVIAAVHPNVHKVFAEVADSEEGKAVSVRGQDTHANSGTENACRTFVAGAVQMLDHIVSGATTNAIVMGRPPGHHAFQKPSGFCIINNAVAAAHYARLLKFQRIAIVDFDLHFGDGTCAHTKGNPDFLYISVHAQGISPVTDQPIYPSTPAAVMQVKGPRGSGVLNLVLEPDFGDDEFFSPPMRSKIAARLKAFEPDLIIVSAGFDAYTLDPCRQTTVAEEGGVSPEAFEDVTRFLVGQAQRLCNGRLLSLLEGGYHTNVLSPGASGLCRCLYRHLQGLCAQPGRDE